MSKLLSLTMSTDLGGLKAQEIDFNTNGDIVEVKGTVGSGKTTAQRANEIAMSGAKTTMFDDPLAFGDFDNEVCILAGQKLYMRTYCKDGNWKSVVHQKSEDGKISKDPIINGKKMTPAVARETFQTELTFGAGRFISQDPREHLKFMMDTYSWKLKDMGVIFDKSAPDYVNSILWRLDQSKLDRGQKEYHKKAVNGFKNHLEAEGWDEQNIPGLIDISLINAEITILNNKRVADETAHREKQFTDKQTEINRIQSEIDKLTTRGSELMGVITAYNSGLENHDELRRSKLEQEIAINNGKVDKIKMDFSKIKLSRDTLVDKGCPSDIIEQIESWMESISMPTWRDLHTELSKLPPLKKVPLTDGKVTNFEQIYTYEVNEALHDLHVLRSEIAPLFAQKANPQIETTEFDPTPYNTEALTVQIETAKATNKIVERWAAFHAHQTADELVKEIWKEYCEMFTRIDLGVAGLTMAIVGDEDKSEIRTKYDGRYNPELFGNLKQEPRLLNAYSETQKPVIAILMQKYLLDEKIAKGEDGLRAIFVEMPMDKATRLTLKQMKNEFDIDIFTSTTGDFDRTTLGDGQFLIEDGVLLTNK